MPYNFAGHNLDWKLVQPKSQMIWSLFDIMYVILVLFSFFFQDGVPRAAYKGVVVFRYKSSPRRIYLVGPDSIRQLGAKHG